MNILAIADRAPRTSVREIMSNNKIDLICTLGDLDYFSLQELQYINDIPKLGVYGNHCSGSYMESLGITNMHLQVVTVKGVKFGGFEGSVRYKQSNYAKMYTQEEAMALLKDYHAVDVMLVHCPPYGLNDEPDELAHQGFKALNTYIDIHKPQYLFHGHTYPSVENLVVEVGGTHIIYVYEDKIVQI